VHLMMKMILRICCTNNFSNSVYEQFVYLCTSSFEEQILLHIGFQPKPQNLSNRLIKLVATICHIWTLPIVTSFLNNCLSEFKRDVQNMWPNWLVYLIVIKSNHGFISPISCPLYIYNLVVSCAFKCTTSLSYCTNS